MVGDSLGYRDHAEVACGVLGYGGCGVVGVVNNWMLIIYVTGAIITMGAALAVEVKSERQVYLGGLLMCGAIWPVLWVAVVCWSVVARPK